MMVYELKESDWKLFRKMFPEWQERYMERLVEEYKTILSSGETASSKFWDLEERIYKDKRKTGVMADDICRSNMRPMIFDLLREGAITKEDLKDFSEELRESVW